ncbi:transposase [Actinophytocola sp. NPDC049390]|uniref:transposase n=1 Tax=Actinophytocola sp. NPDC049390 TaxID=3363894 RepID=UPI003790255E
MEDSEGRYVARKPKRYSPELRAEVVKAVLEGGLSYTEAARDFDLVPQTVHNWVAAEKKKRDEGQSAGARGQVVDDLERRIRELEQENAFLKKAAAFFAKEQR